MPSALASLLRAITIPSLLDSTTTGLLRSLGWKRRTADQSDVCSGEGGLKHGSEDAGRSEKFAAGAVNRSQRLQRQSGRPLPLPLECHGSRVEKGGVEIVCFHHIAEHDSRVQTLNVFRGPFP